MRSFIFIIILSFLSNSFAQTKFKIKTIETKDGKYKYYIIDEKQNILKQLDSAKYIIQLDYDDDYKYFAVFSLRNEKGYCAIDINENILFKVYNTSDGELSPDYLIENKIRIVDENNKIGFANDMGKIIIKPQFEIATSFHKGKAIIGENCEKIPWNLHAKENDCHHYSTVCKRTGYINKKGEILEIGNYTFEQIQKKIKWKSAD
ncbi:MAG TPA: WG repeat-containing protein [Bacteroidales bacterium]|nr:WG repeat-containing protein [Bacteroidales bacterium]